MVIRNANSWLELQSGMYWDTARQSWARGGLGGARVKEQQRPSPESRARRGEAGGGTQANGGFGAYLYLEDIVLALADVGA